MRKPKALVERVTELSDIELHDLCEATDVAIIDGGGFGWLKPPARRTLEAYWRGVLLVPERELFVARLDGVACGLARMLVEAVEARARAEGFRTLNLDVRETQVAAIKLYESLGFTHWGTHPHYARVRGQDVAGLFFYKELSRRRENET